MSKLISNSLGGIIYWFFNLGGRKAIKFKDTETKESKANWSQTPILISASCSMLPSFSLLAQENG